MYVKTSANEKSNRTSDTNINVAVYQGTRIVQKNQLDFNRPRGYNDNILSALAWKMQRNIENTAYRYPVTLYSYEQRMDEVIKDLNEKGGYDFNVSEWEKLYNENGFPGESYYYTFTAAEIEVLSATGIRCAYVGSGEKAENADWNTMDGIDSMLELEGDGCVFSENDVRLKEAGL